MPVYSLYSFHRTFIPGFEYLTPSGFISSFEYLTHCGPVSCGHVSLHIIIIIYFLRHFFSCHCYIIYKRFTSNFINLRIFWNKIIFLFFMQDQISQLNTNMERLIEQIADANNKRYGRSSEKLETISGQMELELIVPFFSEAICVIV